MDIFSADELVSILTEWGCDNHDPDSFIRFKINELEKEAINSVPSHRTAYQGQTRENFIEAVKAICKARTPRVKVSSHKEDEYVTLYIEVHPDDDFFMDVYTDRVKFIGWEWPLYLQRMDVNALAHMVADEDGALYQLHLLDERLRNSIWYCWGILQKMHDEGWLQTALSDESVYDVTQSEFSKMHNEILPLEKFMHICSWEEALREHGIRPALKMLDDIDRYVKGKSPKSADKYKKRFCNAQNVLRGAQKRGLISEEEAKRIIGWDEYINPIVSDYSKETIVNDYLKSLEKAYQDTLEDCDARGTQYMAKKKQKILSDMEICRNIKAGLGVDCFIDKSMHSGNVYHLNVILNGNNTLVFRIPKKTPDMSQIEMMVNLSRIMENISATLGKTIRLTSYKSSRHDRKLTISAPKELMEAATELSSKLKFVKGGQLTVTNSYTTLHLPVCGLEWCIAIKRNEMAETIDAISGMLADYMKIYNKLEYKDVKGIYSSRMPNL